MRIYNQRMSLILSLIGLVEKNATQGRGQMRSGWKAWPGFRFLVSDAHFESHSRAQLDRD